jgi:hypothetical protein
MHSASADGLLINNPLSISCVGGPPDDQPSHDLTVFQVLFEEEEN